MAKVRCGLCENYDGGKCIKKNCTVTPNKSRNCDMFIADIKKMKEKTRIPTIRGHNPAIAKKLRYEARKEMKKAIAEAERDKRNLEDKRELMGSRVYDDKHPLTGDLSKFTTTAPKE